MIVTFILGVLAALAVPRAEDKVRDLVAQTGFEDLAAGEAGLKVLTLTLLLLLAALVGSAVASGSALILMLGATAGILGPRVIERQRTGRYPDYD